MATSPHDDRPATRYTPTLRTDSEHEEPLLAFFALHRIATPYSILEAFSHRFQYHSTLMPHLHWLANRGYLRRHSYGQGYVFNITQTGYDRCRDFRSIDLDFIPHRYEEPSGTQLEHELLITKTAIGIYKHVRESGGIQLLRDRRFMLQQLEWIDPESGEVTYPFEKIIPDYWYMIRDENGMIIRFVEAIVGEGSPTRVRQKFREYEQWSQQPHVQRYLMNEYAQFGASEPVAEFEVHCILESKSWKHTDAWKERMTMMQTFQVEPSMQRRIWTATKDEIEKATAEGLSINNAVWHKAEDLIEKRDEWRRSRPGVRTKLLDRYMRNLDAVPLFA